MTHPPRPADDGSKWSGQARIPSATSTGEFTYAASPLVTYAGLMSAMWPAGSNGTLEYAAFGGSWSAPAALAHGGVLDYGGPAVKLGQRRTPGPAGAVPAGPGARSVPVNRLAR
jgi:hypothetical protein